MMSDVLPPQGDPSSGGGPGGAGGPPNGAKNPAAIGRLKRRMDGYRHHEDKSMRQYESTVTAFNGQQMNETLALRQKFLESTKSKKGSKKSSSQAATAAAAANSEKHKLNAALTANAANNGGPSYSGGSASNSGGGIKRSRPSLEGDTAPKGPAEAKRPHLQSGGEIKTEAGSSPVSNKSVGGGVQDLPRPPYPPTADPFGGSGREIKSETLDPAGLVKEEDRAGDDTLGDLDLNDFIDENGEGIMNQDMLNHLIGDLQDSDFIENFDFSDSRGGLDDLASSLEGPSVKVEPGEDVKPNLPAPPPASTSGPPISHSVNPSSAPSFLPTSASPMGHHHPVSLAQTSRSNSYDGSGGTGNRSGLPNGTPTPPMSNPNRASPHPHSQAGGVSGNSSSNNPAVPTSLQQMDAAEKLKIMAQQHQQHHAHPMFNNMGPMPPNGAMMRPGGIRPGIRPGAPPSGASVMPPNLPTAPIPQVTPTSSSMPPGTTMSGSAGGIMTSSSPGPIMSRMMGPGAMGGPMPFNGSSPMTAEQVRMRAQSRYRMGTPNPSSIRHPLPPSNSQGPGGPPHPQQQQQHQHQPQPQLNQTSQSMSQPQQTTPSQPQNNPQSNMMQNPAMRNQMMPNGPQMTPQQQQHMMMQQQQQQQRMQHMGSNPMGMMRPNHMGGGGDMSNGPPGSNPNMMGPRGSMMGGSAGPPMSNPQMRQMSPQMMMQMQQMQHQQSNRPPPPEYGQRMGHQNQNMPYMMGQMPGNMPPNMRFPTSMGPGGHRMGGPRGGPGFQQIPPSGPMMRQQQQQQQQQHHLHHQQQQQHHHHHPMGMGPQGVGESQRMRFPPGAMGMANNGAKQVPMSHGGGPSGPPQHPMMGWGPNGAPNHMGMGNVPMSGGSPNHPIVQGQNLPMGSPRGPMGSPRPQGDINHGSPMMPHNSHPNIRSQAPGGHMGGPGGINPAMSANLSNGPPNGPHQSVRMPGHPVGAMPQRMPNMPLPNQPNPQQQNPNQTVPNGPSQVPGPPSQAPPPQQQQQQQTQPIHSPHMSHNSPMNHHSPMIGGYGHSHSPMAPQQHPVTSPMGQRSNTPSHQHNGVGQGGGAPQQQQHPNNNASNNKSDDFNLDFLDSIPSGPPNQGHQGPMKNGAGGDEILNTLFN